jgi:hypothetical protein
MHRTSIAVALVISLAACVEITAPDLFACEPAEPIGSLRVTIVTTPSFVGSEELVFVGDTLPLTAEVRPVVGGVIDAFETGRCYAHYGDPVRAAIEWWSSDDRIATVSAAGVVTGRSPGDVQIAARVPLQSISSSRRIGVRVRGGGAP